MNHSQDYDEPLDEIEALICAAQAYVQPSEDLRPRVMEVARVQRREQRTRSHIERLAVLSLLLAALVVSLPSWTVSPSIWGTAGFPGALGGRGPLGEAEIYPRSGDATWSMVESFTELRRRQAEVLRPISPRPPRGV